jgi:hypothetical protein
MGGRKKEGAGEVLPAPVRHGLLLLVTTNPSDHSILESSKADRKQIGDI